MRILRRFLARVKNFAMGQRSREFGIRIAVGATRGNVMAVVFHQDLRWVTDEITLNWMIGRSTVQQVIRGVVLIHLGVISSRIAGPLGMTLLRPTGRGSRCPLRGSYVR
jgi:hypothetical protein